MFKRLRNQFIMMHMGVVSLIILLFFGIALLFANYGINYSIKDMLNRPHIVFIGDEQRRPDNPLAFYVDISVNGEVSGVTSPYTMSDEFYNDAVKQAISKKASIGQIKCEGLNLAYKINGNKIIFIDISREVEIFRRLSYIFLWIAIPLLVIIFLSSIYFANRSIRPIEISFQRQKEFIADASHELKTPIATISTNADVLLNSADETSVKWANHIKTESGRMASLVGNLLYLAKMDYEDSPKFEPVNVGEVLNDVLLPLEAVIYEKKVDLTVNCEDNVIVNGDRTQIHRLLGILIDNAIKYTSGEISIAVEKQTHHAQIVVQNSGEPIPREKLDKLFERFYRADKSRKYNGGFGLGLSIAKTIVDAHGGKITCESKEDFGTRFSVRI